METAQRPKPKGQSGNMMSTMARLRCGKRLSACAVLLILLLVSTSAQAAHFNYRVIAPEMVGEDVYYLQGFLTRLGLCEGAINEHYDYLTQQAVKRFQQRYRIPDTGWVDGNTATALLSAVNQEASLMVDGQYQLFSSPPVIDSDLFYIPIDAAVELLGIGSEMKGDELRLLYRSESWPVTIADQPAATLDGAGRPVARQWHDTLYLPLRSLAQWVGATVSWENATRTATVILPPDFRPFQATGSHFLRRLTTTAYPDRVRLTFYLSSTVAEPCAPRAFTEEPATGTWRGQLSEITMGDGSYELALNDPTIRTVKLVRGKASIELIVTPSATGQVAKYEWILDPENNRLILDLYRAQ